MQATASPSPKEAILNHTACTAAATVGHGTYAFDPDAGIVAGMLDADLLFLAGIDCAVGNGAAVLEETFLLSERGAGPALAGSVDGSRQALKHDRGGEHERVHGSAPADRRVPR